MERKEGRIEAVRERKEEKGKTPVWWRVKVEVVKVGEERGRERKVEMGQERIRKERRGQEEGNGKER